MGRSACCLLLLGSSLLRGAEQHLDVPAEDLCLCMPLASGPTNLLLLIRFQKIHKFPSSTPLPWGPVCGAMASCHSLVVLDKKIQGDPLDLKMFDGTHWVTWLAPSAHIQSVDTPNPAHGDLPTSQAQIHACRGNYFAVLVITAGICSVISTTIMIDLQHCGCFLIVQWSFSSGLPAFALLIWFGNAGAWGSRGGAWLLLAGSRGSDHAAGHVVRRPQVS